MAKPIKSTPVLEGEDAQLFLENLLTVITYAPSEAEKQAKALELERMKAKYEKLQSIIKCAF